MPENLPNDIPLVVFVSYFILNLYFNNLNDTFALDSNDGKRSLDKSEHRMH